MSKLAEAKALIQERGRTQEGFLEDSDGCLCPLGALNVAYTGDSGEGYSDTADPDLAYAPSDSEHVDDILRLATVAASRSPYNTGPDNVGVTNVFRYNDRRDTTDEDIYSLFDEAMAL